MSRPFELQIYKTWINGLDGTCYCSAFTSDENPGYPVNVDYAILCKQLTAHELAAEWWRQKSWFDTAWRRAENYPADRGLVESREDQWDRLVVAERFATLPHASEADYE